MALVRDFITVHQFPTDRLRGVVCRADHVLGIHQSVDYILDQLTHLHQVTQAMDPVSLIVNMVSLHIAVGQVGARLQLLYSHSNHLQTM